ncbi:UNVERIFIED_CONTAM: hypothetical protein FKN15_009459 [Acipenser sinensis]
MGLLRIMMPPKFQLLAVLAFGVAMLFLENQVQKLEESRGKLVQVIQQHCAFRGISGVLLLLLLAQELLKHASRSPPHGHYFLTNVGFRPPTCPRDRWLYCPRVLIKP